MNPFDYVNSISLNKKNLMRGTENDQLAEKEYAPYLSNKALSYYTDTILYANEMNKHSSLDNKLQYEYLLNSVRPSKRFSKWSKNATPEEVLAISKYYSVNKTIAAQYEKLLPDEEKAKIVAEIKNL
jgi:hypothetical protein